MTSVSMIKEKGPLGPFKPTLIIHGGAGAISRSNLPTHLYDQYRHSLLTYLRSTKHLLDGGASALTAACHAVSVMEDDPLFNCGRGSVFNLNGEIEMEASLMVTSVSAEGEYEGKVKRASAVSLVRETRHPILLAREVLLETDEEDGVIGRKGPARMHVHLSGKEVEEWGWKRGLEKKGGEWFWTRRRWEEHRRGLGKDSRVAKDEACREVEDTEEAAVLPSQGTVGAICLDSWGNLAVATSTGGLTNKKPGRIGDTPTVGAGFWAESWDERCQEASGEVALWTSSSLQVLRDNVSTLFGNCLPFYTSVPDGYRFLYHSSDIMTQKSFANSNTGYQRRDDSMVISRPKKQQRAVATSGTGNGDSFLRTNAARTTAGICRFSRRTLSQAVASVAGAGGELQRSAGDRWRKTGEGEGGIIGIEVVDGDCSTSAPGKIGKVVFDFNCGGMWRAWYDVDPKTGAERERMMVFRDEYKA